MDNTIYMLQLEECFTYDAIVSLGILIHIPCNTIQRISLYDMDHSYDHNVHCCGISKVS